MVTTEEDVTADQGVTTAPVTTAAPLSVRAYARHRQTSAPAVLRAIRAGRLKDCLVRDAKGKAKIADVALADTEWAANTDLSRAPGYVKERETKTESSARPNGPPPPSALVEASTKEKQARAQLAELQYQQKAGLLIDAKVAQAAMVDLVMRSRTKLLGLPNRIKAAMPFISRDEMTIIENLIREALEELADSAAQDRGAA